MMYYEMVLVVAITNHLASGDPEIEGSGEDRKYRWTLDAETEVTMDSDLRILVTEGYTPLVAIYGGNLPEEDLLGLLSRIIPAK